MNGIRIGNKISRLPVIQGGMGVGVSLHRLAGTVAKEGGIGIISTANIGFREFDFDTDPQSANLRAIKKEITMAREIANGGILGVNIMVAAQQYEDLVRECVANGIDLIISGAGLPLKLPELVKGSASKIAPIISSARAFRLILKSWIKRYDYIPDLVIVEGPQAGGHLGFSYDELAENKQSLEDIVLEVLAAAEEAEQELGVKIPVIAAGGIFTNEDVVRVMELGAAGVQIATRFVATEECDAASEFKQAYIDATDEDVEIIKSPVGMPGRAIRNAFIKRVEEREVKIKSCSRCLKSCHIDTAPYCITKALVNSVKGNTSNGLIFCGSNVSRIKSLTTVKKLLDELCGV
ncbi:NAD(P)H-dependent flavin oxidoreductase [Paenibacillus helianthi]|uniref:NAD(P)H-dependent flavin oxidoreductase n=1 Tax=Paenibacillus helianthi TaxID=1349432 RepID=UPI000A74DCA6|nr:nitronate monooxygenase family protein [Paenibacillus helianthi]